MCRFDFTRRSYRVGQGFFLGEGNADRKMCPTDVSGDPRVKVAEGAEEGVYYVSNGNATETWKVGKRYRLLSVLVRKKTNNHLLPSRDDGNLFGK